MKSQLAISSGVQFQNPSAESSEVEKNTWKKLSSMSAEEILEAGPLDQQTSRSWKFKTTPRSVFSLLTTSDFPDAHMSRIRQSAISGH